MQEERIKPVVVYSVHLELCMIQSQLDIIHYFILLLNLYQSFELLDRRCYQGVTDNTVVATPTFPRKPKYSLKFRRLKTSDFDFMNLIYVINISNVECTHYISRGSWEQEVLCAACLITVPGCLTIQCRMNS